MVSLVDVRDGSNGRLLATLPCSTFLWREAPFEDGLAHRVRGAFVAEEQLSAQEAEAAVFRVRSRIVPRSADPAFEAGPS